MERLRLIRQKLSREVIAAGVLVLLHTYTMGATDYIETPNALPLLFVSTVSLCWVLASGSHVSAAIGAVLLSTSVSAAEVVAMVATNDDLLLSRCAGSFVGAGLSAFMLKSKYKLWEVGIIFFLSFGIGMVCYQPFLDYFKWPVDQSPYHLVASCLPAGAGMLVVMWLYSQKFGRWLESKIPGGSNASDSK